MNFQKKSRNGNEKRIFKIILWFEKKLAKFPTPEPNFYRELSIYRMLYKSSDEIKIFGTMNFQKKSRNENKKN